jgi:hypothetical protein
MNSSLDEFIRADARRQLAAPPGHRFRQIFVV